MIKLITEDDNVLYTEKQFHKKLNDTFYKYFPNGECWVRTVTANGATRIDINCFAEYNDNNDRINNIDVLDISLTISKSSISSITFPLTTNSNLQIEAIYNRIKLPEGSSTKYETIPFKTVFGNPDKILRAFSKLCKNAKTVYDEYY